MNILEILLLKYYHIKVFQKRELEVFDANVGVASADSRLIYCVIVSIYHSFDRRFDYGCAKGSAFGSALSIRLAFFSENLFCYRLLFPH